MAERGREEVRYRIIDSRPWVIELIEGFDLGIIPREYREPVFRWLKAIASTIRSPETALEIAEKVAKIGTTTMISTIVSTIVSTITSKYVTETILRKLIQK